MVDAGIPTQNPVKLTAIDLGMRAVLSLSPVYLCP